MLDFNYSTKPFEDTRRQFTIILVLAVLVIITLSVNLYFFIKYRNESAELIPEKKFLEGKKENIEDQIIENKKNLERSDKKSLFKEISGYNRLIEARVFSWTSLLDNLEKAVPSDVMVTSIRPKIENNAVLIALSVKSENYKGILKLITNMGSSDKFTDIYPVFESSEMKGGKKEITADFTFKYKPSTSNSAGKEEEDEK